METFHLDTPVLLAPLGDLPLAKRWYVLRDLSRSNAKIPGYKLLAGEGIEYFTPMHFVVKKEGGRNVRTQEPVLKSLLFAHEEQTTLKNFLVKHPTLQFRYVRGRSIDNPMVVDDRDMERFRHAIESSCSAPVSYRIEEITPDKYGKEVRIVGGRLDGYTGRLLKMRGSSVKRLIVELPGLFLAGVEVQPEYIQFV